MASKICFISPSAYGYFTSDDDFTGGGAQRQIYLLSLALRNEFDVHVIVGDYNQPDVQYLSSVTLHKSYSTGAVSSSDYSFIQFFKLLRAMRVADADVYIDRNTPELTIASYLGARILRRKFVYHVANDANLTQRYDNLHPFLKPIFRTALNNADNIITQKSRQALLVESLVGVSTETIPNGYPPSTSKPGFDKRSQFLWVGSLDKTHKQPHLFLDLAERLPTYNFTMIGPIEEDEYHIQILDRAQEINNLNLVGAVPPSSIYDYYSSAIALISTSAYEGFPNVFLEAWRVGTPVLSLFVPPSDFIDVPFGSKAKTIETLCCWMKNLSENRNIWEEVSLISKNQFEDKYSIGHVSKKYTEFLRSV